jgi:hypothetical protein
MTEPQKQLKRTMKHGEKSLQKVKQNGEKMELNEK